MAIPIQQQSVAPAASATTSQSKDTARSQLTQLVGKMADDLDSQQTDVDTALDAIIAALAAKPSA